MIKKELEYQPKGEMCMSCVSSVKNCSNYDFASMPRISKGDADGMVVVRCAHYKGTKQPQPMARNSRRKK